MQLIFDSRTDSLLVASACAAALSAYIARMNTGAVGGDDKQFALDTGTALVDLRVPTAVAQAVQTDPAGAVAALAAAVEQPMPAFGQSPLPPGAIPNDPAAQTAAIPLPPTSTASTASSSTSSASPAPAAAAIPPATMELDITGLPWDERIHSGKPGKGNKMANGTWKIKRGLNTPGWPEAIVAELRAQYPQTGQAAAATVSTPPAVPSVPGVPAAPAPQVPAPPAVAAPVAAPAVPQVPTPPPAPVAPPAPAGGSYTEFTQWVTPLLAARKLRSVDINAACQRHGLQSMPDLHANPDKIPFVRTELEMQVESTGG